MHEITPVSFAEAARPTGLVTEAALAAALDIHPVTLRKWVKRGCPAYRPGRETYFDPVEVEAWVKSHPANRERAA